MGRFQGSYSTNVLSALNQARTKLLATCSVSEAS